MMSQIRFVLLAVLGLVMTTSLVTAHGGHTLKLARAAPLLQSRLAELGGPEALSCIECELVMGLVYEVANNKTKAANADKFLDGLCEKYFPGAANATLESVCEFAVKEVIALLPTITHAMDTVDWPQSALCSVLLGSCKAPVGASKAPEQIRLSLTATSSEMRVTWVTGQPTTTSTVQWGTASPSSSANGETRTYTSSGWEGVIHTAVMTGLTAGTKYQYRVGDAAGGWSSTMSFSTLPSNAGTAARPLTVIQVGDIGFTHSNGTIANILSDIHAGGVDVILFNGDYSYADGYAPHSDLFGRMMQPITSAVPSFTTPGNHELWFDFEAYRYRYGASNPVNDGNNVNIMYYPAYLPGLSLLCLSTESALDTPYVDPAQLQWLSKELPTARSRAPWLIAAGHRPLYCSNSNSRQCGEFAGYLRDQVEGLFHQHRVDVVMQAHEHSMEHSFPLYNGSVVSKNFTMAHAPVYVVQGAAGNREGLTGITTGQPWSAWHDDTHIGYSKLTVTPTQLTYDFMAANATTGAQRIHSFALTK